MDARGKEINATRKKKRDVPRRYFVYNPRGVDWVSGVTGVLVEGGVRGGAPAGCGAEPREENFGVFWGSRGHICEKTALPVWQTQTAKLGHLFAQHFIVDAKPKKRAAAL